MGLALYHYQIEIRDKRTRQAITSGVYGFIYSSAKTLATIYSNKAAGSKTNPITRTAFAVDDMLDFWCASTSVDVFVNDDLGNSAFVSSVTPQDHTIFLDRDGVDKYFVAAYAANTTETDTGLDFPYNSLVYDFAIEVVTIDATETIDVGLLSSETAGDANGLLSLVPISTAGWVRPWAVTAGSSENYISAVYWGALMGVGGAGTDAVNDFGQPGGTGHVVTPSNAQSLTYTCSAGTDTAAGYIHAFFKQLR